MSYLSMTLISTRQAKFGARGFSLVELLAVVTISSLLALAGVAMFRRHMVASRGNEATAMLEAIRAAENMYMSENHSYLNVSASSGSLWYPQASPVQQRASLLNSNHQDYGQWKKLGLPLDKTVMFSYLANAGPPGSTMPALSNSFTAAPVFPVPQLDWFLIQAKGDTNGNGVFALYATSSLSNEIYSENDGD